MPDIRYALKNGDKTTTGGMLCASGAGMMTHHGQPVGVEGDIATCPACKGTGKVFNDCRPNFDLMGRQLLVSGARVHCGCAKPPLVIPSQSDFTLEVSPGTALAAGVAEPAVAAATLAAALTENGGRASNPPAAAHDEQIRCIDEDGAPIPGVPYFISDQQGNSWQGVTDEAGFCPRIATDGPQTLSVIFGPLALEHWKREER